MNRWTDAPDHRYSLEQPDGEPFRGLLIALLVSLAIYGVAALVWWLL